MVMMNMMNMNMRISMDREMHVAPIGHGILPSGRCEGGIHTGPPVSSTIPSMINCFSAVGRIVW